MSSTYDRLLDLILSNSIEADESLTETRLAEKLHVSRTPVREALKLLEQEGIVERSGRGVRLKVLGPEEILEIYEVRSALEAAAARGAAQRHTDLDLSRLEAIHEEMLKLPESDVEGMISWNYRFHEAMWRASHNATLEGVITRLISRLRRYPQTTLSFPGRWELVLGEHQELIDAIRASDPDRAGTIAGEHMTRARDVRLRMYARQMAGGEE
ncbi:GntR family transcriptional regulator [Planosporangium sp. 12N6]|uniref:GntR family transcriptional regulator n=1 Tax=Planosporangium spinosum TaxID=3402278 RepID=UPI003CEF7A5B